LNVAKQLQFGNVVLCEYVAKGDRNKHTLVNVYTGDIIVATLPARLHLGLYAEYLPDSDVDVAMTLEFQINSRGFANIEIAGTKSSKGKVTIVAIPAMELGIDQDVTLEVFAQRKGYKRTLMTAKRIFKLADGADTAS
jgi:hypothetical protein